jgi:transcriptional regulator of arginine metabolism
MKESRQKLILDAIQKTDIETQNQLIEVLREAGVNATQATISRDIKELHLVKELTPWGVYRYVAGTGEVTNHSKRLQTIFKECVTGIVCAQNIIVIKTLPGLASAACSAIDSMNIKSLAGTLAGDDTAFLAMNAAFSAERISEELMSYL